VGRVLVTDLQDGCGPAGSVNLELETAKRRVDRKSFGVSGQDTVDVLDTVHVLDTVLDIVDILDTVDGGSTRVHEAT